MKTAFPRVGDWQYVNKPDGDHDGFCVWGRFVLKNRAGRDSEFFITFQRAKAHWMGYFTIGLHAFYWSSTDENDAYLLRTPKANDLAKAITALKKEIAELFNFLSDADG